MTDTSQGAADPVPAGADAPEPVPPTAGKARKAAARNGAAGPRSRKAGARARDNAPARRQPVARIAVDIPLGHLDRPFDYLVPERLSAAASPGCRVRGALAGVRHAPVLPDRERC